MERVLDLSGEPTIDDVLNEPAVQCLMAHDGVTRADIDALIAVRRRPDPESARRRAVPARRRLT